MQGGQRGQFLFLLMFSMCYREICNVRHEWSGCVIDRTEELTVELLVENVRFHKESWSLMHLLFFLY